MLFGIFVIRTYIVNLAQYIPVFGDAVRVMFWSAAW